MVQTKRELSYFYQKKQNQNGETYTKLLYE